MFVLNNTTRLTAGKPWTDQNGTQHPANWSTWSKETLESYGIVEVAEDPKPDTRFYSVGQLGLDGKWEATLRKLDDTTEGDDIIAYGVKTQWIAQTKETANTLLAPSDWQVIAKAERDRAIDSDIATYRANVVKKCTEIEAAITACKNMEDFKALFDQPINSDGNTTGNAPIYDWPEQVS